MTRFLMTFAALSSAGAVALAEDYGYGQRNLPGPNPWQVELGAGAYVGPAYLGSDETETRVLPLIDIRGREGRLFLSTREGLGYNLLMDPRVKAGAALTYVPGRDSDDDSRIRGFEDIDAAAGVKVFADYVLNPGVPTEPTFSLGGELEQQLGGSDGLRAKVGLNATQTMSERLRLMGSLSTTWASEEDMQEWFGVTAGQAGVSGLPTYNAGAGFRDVTLSGGAAYKLTPNWNLIGKAHVTQLVGDAADSPITEEETALGALVGVSYRF